MFRPDICFLVGPAPHQQQLLHLLIVSKPVFPESFILEASFHRKLGGVLVRGHDQGLKGHCQFWFYIPETRKCRKNTTCNLVSFWVSK